MMFETLKFLIVEDKEEDRKEILSLLSDARFLPANKLGSAGTYEEAKELLEEYDTQLDVVFLDLNIPRDARDSRPEKRHGAGILEIIHHEFNRRSGIDIRVIVVSSEDLQDGMQERLLYNSYKETLIGIAQKADLTKMLKACVKRLRKDPFRARIRRAELDILDQYDIVNDPSQPIKERVKSARTLAIRLVQNEVDHYNGRLGSSTAYADDLSRLIKEQIESRFGQDTSGKRRVRASLITSTGGWGAFLWRGSMVQHLYTINSYRNQFEHIDAQPYHCQGHETEAWTIPVETLRIVELGDCTGKLVEAVIHEVLEWYLPWHEQVYVPWANTQPRRPE
jgi:CheY-like chemotaxis protein